MKAQALREVNPAHSTTTELKEARQTSLTRHERCESCSDGPTGTFAETNLGLTHHK